MKLQAFPLRTMRLIVLLVTTVCFCVDILGDFGWIPHGAPWHQIMELFIFGGIVWPLWVESKISAKLREDLKQLREQVARLSGRLAQHVESCFRKWQLTPAEIEVAWLLLKGFSFAEIAGIRRVKEKTLRQQATSIYAKAKVGSRSELAAIFLEDVLVESPEATAR